MDSVILVLIRTAVAPLLFSLPLQVSVNYVISILEALQLNHRFTINKQYNKVWHLSPNCQ